MWERKQLKERAKVSFQRNYWKSVLISLLFALVAGGVTAATAFGGDSGNSPEPEYKEGYEITYTLEPTDLHMETETEEMVAIIIVVIVVLIVFLAAIAMVFVFDAFICNPVELGCDRFFFRNLSEPAQVKEAAFGFDHSYKNIVKILFSRDIAIFLWSLLFVIPGIVKSYEYQMIPYLLAEHPEMSKEEAFGESKRMMNGQKWKAFVLDLSFLGWKLLAVMTLGVLDFFYVAPYVNATHAALYEALRYGNPAPRTEGFDGVQETMGA
ncbi:MAG: DUF975 family protein [Blautia sp.]|nr:DUF975 family protein [Blautia sp.]